ncbi:ribonucleases P/MRP protein subunit POP1 [Ixodes scapularis]|uniref:ribonucleases P/MRP protein subunit POP1 n=1 Tax=Ixodes scapularis TaxID=6945 RepID=UPI001C38FE4A|nr:ribonucleases P/MRP protein subunit POP1 [Ixodes scapularis]XP_042142551.1 ribonucleases P/MRP protein subunit POP1 [Ixodes scapularis]XP_042142552.1 ribonucleases P/MRP protein subunit POP1 [Ixodes scapularis]
MENPAEYYKKCARALTEQSESGEATRQNGDCLPGVKLSRKRPAEDEAETAGKQARLEDSPMLVDLKYPREVQLIRLLGSRADEIESLVQDVARKHPKLTLQQVPRHMRRRAVSHDKRRLPKRLKDKLANEPDPPKRKRPSRKHRRRPRNLLAEYARRQRRYVWLETHVWHAKRFKMADLWGYRVPLHPCDKGIRAAYRGSARHVLLHDLSYYNCIELIGEVEHLLEKLSLITSSDAGLTFKAKLYVSGTQEGSTVLYHRGMYPYGAIGPVRFMWRPLQPSKCQSESHSESQSDRQAVKQVDSKPSGKARGQLLKQATPSKCRSQKGDQAGLGLDSQIKSQDRSRDESQPKENRQLWLWVHPSIHDEVCKELTEIFELRKVNSGCETEADRTVSDGTSVAGGSSKHVAAKKEKCKPKPQETVVASKPESSGHSDDGIPPKTRDETGSSEGLQAGEEVVCKAVKAKKRRQKQRAEAKEKEVSEEMAKKSFERVPVYTNEGVSMALLKDNLVRFSLTGPLATAVVFDALVPVSSAEGSSRWANLSKGEDAAVSKSDRDATWETVRQGGLQTDVLLPRGCILGQTVRDPRVLLPDRKTKVTGDGGPVVDVRKSGHVGVASPPPASASDSAIWDPASRDEASLNKMPEWKLNQLRSRNPIPGAPLDIGEEESRIPILLVRKEGSRSNLGFGSGWDVVLPSHWARPFWIALVYRGARAAGLRELRSLSLETGYPCFPFDHPDTRATQEYEEANRRELMAKHLRYPPDKRPSFQKLGVPCPFFFPWKELVHQWAAAVNAAHSGDGQGTGKERPFFVLRSRKVTRRLAALLTEENKERKRPHGHAPTLEAIRGIRSAATETGVDLSRALACVWVSCRSKGVPNRFDSICIPKADDLSTGSPSDGSTGPCESLHKVPRKRKGAEKKGAKRKKKVARPTVEELLARPAAGDVVNCCSRRLIGCMVGGDYCFSEAAGRGVGYVSVLGLLEFVEESARRGTKPLVLLRHQHSVQYRFASLWVLTDC